MADSSSWQLDPKWQQYLDTHKAQTTAPAPSVPTTTTAATGVPATAPAAANAPMFGNVTAGMPAQGTMDALNLGLTQGFGTVLNAPNYITRNLPTNWGVPVVPPTVDVGLTPEQQANVTAHAWAAGTGKFAGETIATLPAAMGAEAILPTLPLIGGVGNLLARGAAQGAAQNVLTGAENPNESILRRAGMGAVAGAAGGVAGGTLGKWFGADVSVPQFVQDAGQTLQNEGVTPTLYNLPGATGGFVGTKTMGAPPLPEQGGQIASAVRRIVTGNSNLPDVPNLNSANWAPLKKQIANDFTAAVNSGQVDAGPAFDQALTQIDNQASSPFITKTVKEIRNRINNGVISGSDFNGLVGPGSAIHDVLDAGNTSYDAFTKQGAQALDSLLDNSFQAGSAAIGQPQAYTNYITGKTTYRLAKAIDAAIDQSTGFVNPTTLLSRIGNRFDLTGTSSLQGNVGRLAKFGAALDVGFGGGTPPNIAAQGNPVAQWIKQHPFMSMAGAAAGGAGGLAGGFNLLTNPAATLGAASAFGLAHIPSLAALGMASAPILGGKLVGQAYQARKLVPNLLATGQGGMPLLNALTPYAPSLAATAVPGPQNPPAR